MKKKILKLVMGAVLVFLLVLIDQLTKTWAVNHLKNAADIIWIEGVFQLHYLENGGMAFGMLQNQQIFFRIMTVIMLTFLLFVYWKTPETKRFLPVNLVLLLLTAGAIGNFIDRVANLYVVDFLYFSLINFPVFNVADIYVTCSAVIIGVLILFVYQEEELNEVYHLGKKKKTASEEGKNE